MSIYVKEWFEPRNIQGVPVLSLLVNVSWRQTPSVYFEVFKETKRWTLYWNYSLSANEVFSIRQEFEKEHMRVASFDNKDLQIELSKHCKTHFCTLSIKEIILIQALAKNGLPEVEITNHGGRDGHSYELECYPITKKYYCHCTVPPEWSDLISFIKLCAHRAHLDNVYLPHQPSRTILGCYEELSPGEEIVSGMSFPSMTDYFEKEPYVNQNLIIEYLKQNGTEVMISMGTRYDFITGEEIGHETLHYADGHYIWTSTLIYYVEKYNLRLPEEFENHVISTMQFLE